MDWKEIGIFPLTDARGITKYFNAETHRGLDIGWYVEKYCPVLAWQDGKLIAKGYSGECGYWLVMEHTYETGKRWTGYIHLYNAVDVAIGTSFKMGEKIGNAKRGNTGKSNGVHLHMYMTKVLPLDEVFVWNNDTNKLSIYAIDPLPHLYYDKQFNTQFISTIWSRPMPEKIIYPKPVERDETKHQVDIKSETRRLRSEPSLFGEIYDEHCEKGIYDVYEWINADGYDWALIDTIDGNPFYVAVMKGEDLPVTDYKDLYEKEKEQNEKLEKANTELTVKVTVLNNMIEEIRNIVNKGEIK